MPKALKRLQRLIRQGLDPTASLWPLVRAAYDGVKRVAKLLANAKERVCWGP